jgi:hypothetical protein
MPSMKTTRLHLVFVLLTLGMSLVHAGIQSGDVLEISIKGVPEKEKVLIDGLYDR